MGIAMELSNLVLFDDNDRLSVTLYASHSLKGALSEVAQAFTRKYKIPIKLEFDNSDSLRERILKSEKADIFAAADFKNPYALMQVSKGSPVVNFVSNRICAIVKPGLKVTPDNLLDLMLASDIRVGIATLNSELSRDYIQQLFQKAEKLKSGSWEKLNNKVIELRGGYNSFVVPHGLNKLAYFILETQQVDMLLTYRTDARLASLAAPNLQILELPENLAVKANYGMTLINNSRSTVVMLAMYILSPLGQEILAKYHFDTPLL
ncbi:hypothetical protein NIES37_39130 [Tolypothrix tenuis PCC 7101]|uniref:Molybdenum ABC transporter periplasmic molybdate-binding protein n=1 Tax=Tolypothrix tenuis PCC 7101 TaxID=231146 RepID=A0A1Z4N2K7_9CYAN|nr:substrate-binding domain-containing protein [Aulosira sp. FACHB-113]BAY99930.1 hypothetical protein NIES37_39130 [Tolypothrix tenuis PCC 7101]BAZ76148.1 hypothetical protein NIES50_47460 [Aulosira laxa NIES-50]